MSLLKNINEELKLAMKSKDSLKLESFRAIKSAMLLSKTSTGGNIELSLEEEIKLLQRLVKQRKDSAVIYRQENRIDLAEPEEQQADVIMSFLPEQASAYEIEKIVLEIINKINAEGIKDMGKVMGMATKELSGKAEGKIISGIVKSKLL
tara:strand:+ start:961 stop:1410 length:450 start_codon:yes stop_codon:yes gene_type:complete